MLGTVVIYHDFKKICQHKRSPWIASAGCQSPLMFHCQPQNRLLKHSRIITHACHFQRELSVSKAWWSPFLNDSFRNACKGEALEANFCTKGWNEVSWDQTINKVWAPSTVPLNPTHISNYPWHCFKDTQLPTNCILIFSHIKSYENSQAKKNYSVNSN